MLFWRILSVMFVAGGVLIYVPIELHSQGRWDWWLPFAVVPAFLFVLGGLALISAYVDSKLDKLGRGRRRW